MANKPPISKRGGASAFIVWLRRQHPDINAVICGKAAIDDFAGRWRNVAPALDMESPAGVVDRKGIAARNIVVIADFQFTDRDGAASLRTGPGPLWQNPSN